MKKLTPVLLTLLVLLTGCGTGDVVINFWATWCKPCVEEMPEFVDLQREYDDGRLQFVGVSVDRKGFEAVRPFAERMNINYPLVIADSDIIEEYGGVSVIPTTFVVGKGGHIREEIVGRTTKSDLMSVVRGLLEESPGEVASTSK